MNEKTENCVLRMENITKAFPGVVALDGVDFDLKRGEVHVLLGENGAGKSTLIKIISGVYQMDSGEILLDEQKIEIKNPAVARSLGICTAYQELDLIPSLSIAENLFLGYRMNNKKMVHWSMLKFDAKKVFHTLGMDMDVNTLVENLTIGEQQLVTIAKALAVNAKILILDEPTAALSDQEAGKVFHVVENLVKQGVSVIFITHKLDEVYKIGHRVTVFRDGRKVASRPIEDTTPDQLIAWIAGRDLKDIYPSTNRQFGEEVLTVRGLSYRKTLNSIEFSVREKEIFGVFGQVGSGARELSLILAGALLPEKGSIHIGGLEAGFRSPLEAIRSGVCLIPEDRRNDGLCLMQGVDFNVTLASVRNFSKFGLVSTKMVLEMTDKMINKLKIKTPNPKFLTKNLSGGNQQKVVIAKWLLQKVRIMIFNEPTRGIDVGSRSEIYELIHNLANQGISVIIFSTDLNEVMGVCDRFSVMKRGLFAGQFFKGGTNAEEVLKVAMA